MQVFFDIFIVHNLRYGFQWCSGGLWPLRALVQLIEEPISRCCPLFQFGGRHPPFFNVLTLSRLQFGNRCLPNQITSQEESRGQVFDSSSGSKTCPADLRFGRCAGDRSRRVRSIARGSENRSRRMRSFARGSENRFRRKQSFARWSKNQFSCAWTFTRGAGDLSDNSRR